MSRTPRTLTKPSLTKPSLTEPSLTKQTLHKSLAILLAILTLLSAAPMVPSEPAENEKHLSVYAPVANYTLPILDRAGHEYVGLLELLEPLGRVSSRSEGQRWRLRYNALDADFIAGKTRARIAGRDFDLTAPFLMDDSRGLVPLSSLNGFLPRFLGGSVNFHEAARRLLVGNVGIQISFQLDATNPPRLEVNFSAPVNPTISTEPGRLRMVFRRDPVVSPGSQPITFDNKVITHAAYSENNGDAALDVVASEPLMASFSNNRKTIIVSAPEQTRAALAVAEQPNKLPSTVSNPSGTVSKTTDSQTTGNNNNNVAVSNSNTSSSAGIGSNANAASNTQRIPVVVDPAHGGDERGAALSDTLAEKDVTLGFARLLRHELESRGFAVILLRDSDASLTLDQRASAANLARAAIYITLHADSLGSGVRLYTALLPVQGASHGVFHAWNASQELALPVSRVVAAAIVAEMQKNQFPVREYSAALRPLNNVSIPAVAVELAPGENGIADLTSANYQQRAASAIADAVASIRDRLGIQQ